MELFSSNDSYKLYKGDMRNMLNVIRKESIDAVLTDPPYELNFMGKGWDNAGVSFNSDTWKNCYEVLKPGGYLLAFGGSRTYHRIACAIEDAGFEIRDTIMWLYGSGFPKSMNIGLAIDKKNGVESKVVGKGKSGKEETHTNSLNMVKGGFGGEYEIKEAQNEWQGWGTCLKPSFEPIIVARKPFKGSLVDNVIEYGVGGINIDECRVETNDKLSIHSTSKNTEQNDMYKWSKERETFTRPEQNLGRFPANTILTYDETDFDEVCGGFPYTNSGKMKLNSEVKRKGITEDMPVFNSKNCGIDVNKATGLCSFGDSGSASRYFYCAKASKKDRDEGLDNFEEKTTCVDKHYADEYKKDVNACSGKYNATQCPKKNIHPTVKPTELMQYLVRLVTPNGGTVLDPFNGSGSTGKAVMYENKERNKGYKYIGIELTEEYLPIAQARIEYVSNLKEEEKPQTTIFDYIGDSNE